MGSSVFPEPLLLEEAPVLTEPVAPAHHTAEPSDDSRNEQPRRTENGLEPPRPVDWKRWVTLGVVAANTLLLVRILHPSLLLKDTTATGGDTGAHVLAPDYLRHHLLGKWRLSGWSND